MEVVIHWQVRGYGNKGNDNGCDNGGRDAIVLAITRAGIGQCNESRQGKEEDAVIMAAAILLC